MKCILAVVAILGMISPPVRAWIPDECDAGYQREIAEHQRLFKAEASKPGGLPHPYPASEVEILADLRNELEDHFDAQAVEETSSRKASDSGQLAAEEFLRRWAGGELRFEQLEVENWSPTRCAGSSDLAKFYLVRAFDSSSDVEVFRGALGRDGHLSQWTFFDASAPDKGAGSMPIAPLSTGSQKLRGALPSQARDFQYIAAAGVGVRCPVLAPCIAARDNAQFAAVLHQDAIYTFGPKSVRRPHSQARSSLELSLTIGSRLAVGLERK